MSYVTWLVGNAHVGESNLDICRLIRKKAGRRYWKAPKATRHAALKEGLQAHKENRKLYRDVMSGNI